MQCSHCRSRMQQTDSVTEGRALQVWYECPVCDAVQTVSQPHEEDLRRIGDTQRCSSGWPTETLYPWRTAVL